MAEITNFTFDTEREAHESLWMQKEVVAFEASDRMIASAGGLLAVAGPMESGKSTVLIMIEEHLLARGVDPAEIRWFKPEIRFGDELISDDPTIYIRDNGEVHADLLTAQSQLSEENLPAGSYVLIDEGQFLPDQIRAMIVSANWKERRVNVVVTGLDKWHHGGGWESMHEVMNAADEVFYLNALCDADGCLNIAAHTQQLVDGEHNPRGPDVAIRAEDEDTNASVVMAYDARCPEHHVGLEREI